MVYGGGGDGNHGVRPEEERDWGLQRGEYKRAVTVQPIGCCGRSATGFLLRRAEDVKTRMIYTPTTTVRIACTAT